MATAHDYNALPVGSMIQEYRITDILGSGSFGIVYKAENIYLDEVVAIKEFLPTELASRAEGTEVVPLSDQTTESYQWALDRFLKEAQILWNLARPDRHPNIIRVTRFHQQNGTGYMVMDYESGQPLSSMLSQRNSAGEATLAKQQTLTAEDLAERTVDEEQLRSILMPLLDGLEHVHAASVWHRDIKPANILIRPDGSPVLIDFGAAREEKPDRDKSVIAMYSPAYAAPEQVYAMGDQGPWTDIYSLGATLFRAIAGKPPAGASERALGATHVSAMNCCRERYSLPFLSAIDAALALRPEERPQSVAAWRDMFNLPPESIEDPDDSATVIMPSPQAAPPSPTAAPAIGGQQPDQATGHRRETRKSGMTSLWLALGFVVTALAGIAGYVLLSGEISEPPAEPVEPAVSTAPRTEIIAAEVAEDKSTPADEMLPPAGSTPPEIDITDDEPTTPPLAEEPIVTEPEPIIETSPMPTPEPVAIRPDRSTLLAALGDARQGLGCSSISTELSAGNDVVIKGYVGSATGLRILQDRIADIPGIQQVTSAAAVYPLAICESLQWLAANTDQTSGPEIAVNSPDGRYREGDYLVIEITDLKRDGYLYVDYLDSEGTVVHMLPTELMPYNNVSAGDNLVLGALSESDDQPSRRYEIYPPHGTGLITALLSPHPLHDTLRPEVEAQGIYMAELKSGLSGQDGSSAGNTIQTTAILIQTRP